MHINAVECKEDEAAVAVAALTHAENARRFLQLINAATATSNHITLLVPKKEKQALRAD